MKKKNEDYVEEGSSEDNKIIELQSESNIYLRILAMFIIFTISIILMLCGLIFTGSFGILFLIFIGYGIKKKIGIAYKMYLLLGNKDFWDRFVTSKVDTNHSKNADRASGGSGGSKYSAS